MRELFSRRRFVAESAALDVMNIMINVQKVNCLTAVLQKKMCAV